MSKSTLTSKGQTTIPKDIREYMNLRPGDQIEFFVDADGRVTLVTASVDVADLEGVLSSPAEAVSLDEMENAIRKRAKGKNK